MTDGPAPRDWQQVLISVLEWSLLLMAGWILLSGAFWADVGGQTVSILTVVQMGAPLWFLLLPLFGLAAMILLVRGYQILVIPGAFAYAFGCLSSFNWYDVHPALEPSVAAIAAFLLFFPFALLAISLSVLKPVPPTRLLQRISLLGRRGLIRGMMSLAAEHGWQTAGPDGPFNVIAVSGEWKGRSVFVDSTRLVGMTTSISTRVWVRTASRPWALFVGTGFVTPSHGAKAIYTNCRDARNAIMDIYVWPPALVTAPPSALDGLAFAIEGGRHFFRHKSRLVAGEDAIFFERNSEFRTALTRSDLEETLDWLLTVVEAIERDGLVYSTEQ
jgi:hypothetical protein